MLRRIIYTYIYTYTYSHTYSYTHTHIHNIYIYIYALWFVISWQLKHRHIVHCFTWCVVWKLHCRTCNEIKFSNYWFELSHNVAESTKNICCVKGEGAVDHNRVTRRLKTFRSGCKKFEDQARWSRPKSVDSEVGLEAKEANPASSTGRVSGKLDILQSRVVGHRHDHSKSIRRCRILQNFWHLLPFYWWV